MKQKTYLDKLMEKEEFKELFVNEYEAIEKAEANLLEIIRKRIEAKSTNATLTEKVALVNSGCTLAVKISSNSSL